jgi:glyoxylase-like metal-dependent hydrolase (beta-lactamase superfamily II)
VEVRFIDELEFGFGWIAPEPAHVLRASHALADDGRVWVVDPVDGDDLDERIRELGEPAGVLQLVDRHGRDCAAFAARYGVPLHVTPFDGVPGSPFEVRRIVRIPGWKEVALWWPERRALVVGDALGTVGYFRARGEELGVHPLLRLTPPRSLAGLEPEHMLCGHGQGVHGPEATAALREALAMSRRRIPSWLVGLARRG